MMWSPFETNQFQYFSIVLLRCSNEDNSSAHPASDTEFNSETGLSIHLTSFATNRNYYIIPARPEATFFISKSTKTNHLMGRFCFF